MEKIKGTHIYHTGKNHDRLIDVYIKLNDLLDHSLMIYGEDDEIGGGEEYRRKSYREMLKELKQVLKK